MSSKKQSRRKIKDKKLDDEEADVEDCNSEGRKSQPAIASSQKIKQKSQKELESKAGNSTAEKDTELCEHAAK